MKNLINFIEFHHQILIFQLPCSDYMCRDEAYNVFIEAQLFRDKDKIASPST